MFYSFPNSAISEASEEWEHSARFQQSRALYESRLTWATNALSPIGTSRHGEHGRCYVGGCYDPAVGRSILLVDPNLQDFARDRGIAYELAVFVVELHKVLDRPQCFNLRAHAMARCENCGHLILNGGIQDGTFWYCNEECERGEYPIRSERRIRRIRNWVVGLLVVLALVALYRWGGLLLKMVGPDIEPQAEPNMIGD